VILNLFITVNDNNDNKPNNNNDNTNHNCNNINKKHKIKIIVIAVIIIIIILAVQLDPRNNCFYMCLLCYLVHHTSVVFQASDVSSGLHACFCGCA
jgi:hypothetical protein